MKDLKFTIKGIPEDTIQKLLQGISELNVKPDSDEFVLDFKTKDFGSLEKAVCSVATNERIREFAINGLALYSMQKMFETKSLSETEEFTSNIADNIGKG